MSLSTGTGPPSYVELQGADGLLLRMPLCRVGRTKLIVIYADFLGYKTRGGSLDTSFLLLAIWPRFCSDVLALFRVKMKDSTSDRNVGKIANSREPLVSCLNQLRSPHVFIGNCTARHCTSVHFLYWLSGLLVACRLLLAPLAHLHMYMYSSAIRSMCTLDHTYIMCGNG